LEKRPEINSSLKNRHAKKYKNVRVSEKYIMICLLFDELLVKWYTKCKKRVGIKMAVKFKNLENNNIL